MFEFNPELVEGDDQEATEESLYPATKGEEEEEAEKEEFEQVEPEEVIDVTNTTGYSNELLPPPPVTQTQSDAEVASDLKATGE